MGDYGDIDFEEINDQTGLAPDEIKCLKVSTKYDEFGTRQRRGGFVFNVDCRFGLNYVCRL